MEAEPQPTPAAPLRWPRFADIAPELAAAYRLVVDVPAPPLKPRISVIPEIVSRWPPAAVTFREAAE